MPESKKEKVVEGIKEVIDEYEMILNELQSVSESIRNKENSKIEFRSNKDVVNERILI